MDEHVIELKQVRKAFGRTPVLNEVTLSVPAGQTFAFLGRNGAGKTTTIRMLVGLIQPEAGDIRVLGMDPRRQALAIRRSIGYLAEDQQLFGWMRVQQTLEFMTPFYPTWDAALARKLLERFELSPRQRVKHLSKGQSVRLGLLLALAHRPRMMILDDPALGLDPIMRKQLNRDVIALLQGDGVTVFYSSHLLYEVEPVADQVAILDHGRIIVNSPTEDLRDDVKQIVIPHDEFDAALNFRGDMHWRDVQRGGREMAITLKDAGNAVDLLQANRITHRVVDLNLDEIFEAMVVGRPDYPTSATANGVKVEEAAV